MRLINAEAIQKGSEIQFKWFSKDVEDYAILSHRWVEGEELTYQGALAPNHAVRNSSGYSKVRIAALLAMSYRLKWIWCDTCCIDKTSSAELSEAINSMFRWYRESKLCLAYLADVPKGLEEPQKSEVFKKSEWFDRVWTLQELVAPSKLIFFDAGWKPMGTKHQYKYLIEERTKIDRKALESLRLGKYSIAQKMSWAAGRKASRVEDIAYSLLGIFDVNMPMLYGEAERAFVRLQEEIIKREADQSIFSWFADARVSHKSPRGSKYDHIMHSLFATEPKDFEACRDLHQQPSKRKPFAMNNVGLEIEAKLRPYGRDTYIAYLPVEDGSGRNLACMKLDVSPETGGLLYRTGAELHLHIQKSGLQLTRPKRVTVLRGTMLSRREEKLFGFRLVNEQEDLTLINGWDPEHKWDLGIWEPEPHHAADSNVFLQSGYKFEIPKIASASVAMIKLKVNGFSLLVQLTYDFEFHPCCHISELHVDPRERFSRRTGLRDDGLDWIDREIKWTDSGRYFENYDSTNRTWIAKAKDSQGFEAEVPRKLTRFSEQPLMVRLKDIEVEKDDKFSRAWTFQFKTSSSIVRPQSEAELVKIIEVNTGRGGEDRMAQREPYSALDRLKRSSTSAPAGFGPLHKRTDTM